MKIIGVGCGPGMMTEEAIRALSDARHIFGSRRAIDLAAAHIPPGCEVREITAYNVLRSLPDDAFVLSTGDPMLAGLGYLGGEIIPGISSMQVAFARLGIPLARAAVVNAHGKDHAAAMDEAVFELGRGKIIFCIADPRFDIAELGARIQGAGIAVRIAVCERLGYPDERITTGTPAEPPGADDELFALVIGDF
ncbi:MAG: cobalt-precorrin-6Y C(5)-methyltransferase [Methanoculleus sp. SDB]|nr:MAG: cobalt-precorrin-6Y C(5)-methyltransferase [Methanoculleus sp. SDB]